MRRTSNDLWGCIMAQIFAMQLFGVLFFRPMHPFVFRHSVSSTHKTDIYLVGRADAVRQSFPTHHTRPTDLQFISRHVSSVPLHILNGRKWIFDWRCFVSLCGHKNYTCRQATFEAYSPQTKTECTVYTAVPNRIKYTKKNKITPTIITERQLNSTCALSIIKSAIQKHRSKKNDK